MERAKEQGVSLSQLPLLLKTESKNLVNFQILGFPKLKNFIETLSDEVVLVKKGNNHIKAFLKQFCVSKRKFSQLTQSQKNLSEKEVKSQMKMFGRYRGEENKRKNSKLTEEISS